MGKTDWPPDMPPRLTIEAFTEDQIAMLKLMGGDPETAPRCRALLYQPGHESLGKIPRSRPGGVALDHACPMVEYRGRWRMITPRGDVRVCDPPSE